MKALEKDRVRRYETAHALALDIERHLNDEPVLAGPPSGSIACGSCSAATAARSSRPRAVVLALIAGVIGTSWALLRAVRAERQAAAEAVEARRQTAIAEAVNGFLNNDLLAAARPSAARGQGKDVTMRQVLDVAAERIDARRKAADVSPPSRSSKRRFASRSGTPTGSSASMRRRSRTCGAPWSYGAARSAPSTRRPSAR